MPKQLSWLGPRDLRRKQDKERLNVRMWRSCESSKNQVDADSVVKIIFLQKLKNFQYKVEVWELQSCKVERKNKIEV